MKDSTFSDRDSQESKPIGYIPYPCCPKEKAAYFADSKGHSSIKCPNCKKYVLFDWDNKEAKITGAVRNLCKLSDSA